MQPLFHNNRSFLKKVDELPHGAAWSCKKISVQGNRTDQKGEPLQEDVELWMRNPVECIKDLIGNPLFKDHMVYTPAHAYKDSPGLQQVIDNMWTADWWCDKQKQLPKGVTIVPVILASDKTCLSQFWGNKSAYPVYLSIGNIAKEKWRQIYQLFHHCMSLLLQPLISAGEDGVEMVHLILAAYVADFPEQCLVACCKENCCPKCLVATDERGNPLTSLMQDPALIKELLEKRKAGHHPAEFDDYGLHTVYTPFWANLPHSDIFLAFTPDLLHQLHKGIFKDHLVKWCLDIVGEEGMDTQFKTMPDYPGLRHFKKGISSVKQWTGTEHKEMQRVFLALLAGSIPSQVLDVLQELNIHKHFNIPKLHQLSHFAQSVLLFGATDGFNMYRASNKRDYEEQMALWLQHQEASTSSEHRYDSDSDCETEGPGSVPVNALPILPEQQVVHVLAKMPAYPQRSVQHLITAHGATMFLPALKFFLCNHMPPSIVVITAQPNPLVSESPRQWCVRATPEVPPGCGQKPGSPTKFDMALMSNGIWAHTLEVAQVRIIFTLPHQFGMYPQALAYIEWFMLLRELDPFIVRSGASVVEIRARQGMCEFPDEITHPCHLIPKMEQSVDRGWTSTNVYELASDFYLNTYIDLDTFSMSTIN
ncbi:hypothetical protein BDR07DRAFT_1538284 [Suillus spraguei]|nr:hypothetical protein BDR07DRAFT_1538284 [Suillus spraguei]